jgi:hypothetical protein
LFSAVPELENYTYLITELEINRGEHVLMESSPLIITGSDLRKIVESDKIQFIWAVLSAFGGDVTIPEDLPFADMNAELWTSTVKPQIKESDFEIVCWDSSATLFIGVDNSVAAQLVGYDQDIQSIDDFNQAG